jgi:hypothetical protein
MKHTCTRVSERMSGQSSTKDTMLTYNLQNLWSAILPPSSALDSP